MVLLLGGEVGGRGGQESVKRRPPHSPFTGFDLGVVVSSRGVEGWGCSVCGQKGFTYEVWTLIRDQLQPLQTLREKIPTESLSVVQRVEHESVSSYTDTIPCRHLTRFIYSV